MAGNKEGAKKAAETNKKKYGADFYAVIGAKSWDNPDRSRETGFSLLPPEERARLGAQGGKKNKKKNVEYLSPEEAIKEIENITKLGTDAS